MDTNLYYEIHISITPEELENRKNLFKSICKGRGFWVSDWQLKDKAYTFFATSRAEDQDSAVLKTVGLLHDLRSAGFNTERYKIEKTIIDSKINPILGTVSNFNEIVNDFDKVGVYGD